MKYLSFFLLILSTFNLYGQTEKRNFTYLSVDTLNKYDIVYLDSNWVYHPGDNIEWAKTNYDDSGWENTFTSLSSSKMPEQGFDGKGWFRLKLQIDSSLINKPLALGIWLSGACEIYINGRKLFKFGEILSGGRVINKIPMFPKNFVLSDSAYNVIAVRYFNNNYEDYQNFSQAAGFSLRVGLADKYVTSRYNFLARQSLHKIIFITIPLSLAILHLFLFLFDRRQKQNLYYVIFLLSFSVFIFLNYTTVYSVSAYTRFVMYRLSIGALIFTLLFGSTTIYSIYKPLPKYYKYVLLTAVLLSVAGYIFPGNWMWYISYIFITTVSIVGSQVLYNPLYKKPTGSDRILQIGFAVMAAAGIWQMLLSIGIIDPFFGFYSPYIYGVIFFIFAMSISLARDFAITRKNLEKKLQEVKELSEKTLKQELAAKELETKRIILEADNKRKTDELVAAREVQLAMLPQCSDELAGFNVCFEMQPATEVGGDYYDYIITKDNTLNIAVGDATGHGMKAGIMVATIKSLFSALGTKMMIPDFFNKATEIIKNMTLGNLFMSMTVARIKNYHVHGSAAGMPPILVYRKSTNSVEEVLLKSMPLGAHNNFPYETFDFDVEKGDIILMMSDGYLEMFNDEKQMLGLERTKEYLIEASEKNANDIAQYLLTKGKEWRKNKPQNDDVTFVILKTQ